MTFDEILDQAIEMLQRRGRLAYRTLKRQFDLDDETLEDLKEELHHEPRPYRPQSGQPVRSVQASIHIRKAYPKMPIALSATALWDWKARTWLIHPVSGKRVASISGPHCLITCDGHNRKRTRVLRWMCRHEA